MHKSVCVLVYMTLCMHTCTFSVCNNCFCIIPKPLHIKCLNSCTVSDTSDKRNFHWSFLPLINIWLVELPERHSLQPAEQHFYSSVHWIVLARLEPAENFASLNKQWSPPHHLSHIIYVTACKIPVPLVSFSYFNPSSSSFYLLFY